MSSRYQASFVLRMTLPSIVLAGLPRVCPHSSILSNPDHAVLLAAEVTVCGLLRPTHFNDFSQAAVERDSKVMILGRLALRLRPLSPFYEPLTTGSRHPGIFVTIHRDSRLQ